MIGGWPVDVGGNEVDVGRIFGEAAPRIADIAEIVGDERGRPTPPLRLAADPPICCIPTPTASIIASRKNDANPGPSDFANASMWWSLPCAPCMNAMISPE